MTLSKVDASSQANSSLPLSLSPYLFSHSFVINTKKLRKASPYWFSHSFVINTKKLRKAKQNLEATKNPVVVIDSLPYGADTGDTPMNWTVWQRASMPRSLNSHLHPLLFLDEIIFKGDCGIGIPFAVPDRLVVPTCLR